MHIWGIEFVLNLIIMHLVSLAYPNTNTFKIQDIGVVEMKEWKYAKVLGVALIIITIIIYILLGNVG